MTCDCGRPSSKLCSDVQPEGITLVRCQKPICGIGEEGTWCNEHRHESGTMGYIGQMRVSANYEGEDAEGEGFWSHLVALWQNHFWSAEQQAQHVWKKLKAREFKPPRPLPDKFELNIRGFIFELHEDTMVKRSEAK